jgi:hypothetical protein
MTFRNEANTTISAAAFFAQAPDRLVDVNGTAVNGDINADQAELEN